MTSLPFEILLEDSAVLVVNKPAGILTQAPLGIDSLEWQIKRYLQSTEKSEVPYLGVPHRLDRPVSGCICFAKNQKAARKISQQFEARLVQKTYWALVSGIVHPTRSTWVDHLKKLDGEPRTIVVDERDPEGKNAILHYELLETREGRSLLAITLETGRTHQIRVQCGSRGFPLLGDRLYGSAEPFGPLAADERDQLIALHARTLAFRHPVTKEDLIFTAQVPAIWSPFGLETIATSRPDSGAVAS
ncbi:pseudouridine synthase [Pirellula staleyi DSM 6068]|uniref:Pseudouridine synthase n=1 Tax=Pirellula staleyi (strain ATCC 27377 / DSM 6068 / ICPB 4128) TaxID=530564 RepID=D2R7R1_PIRSD|nr:RluA family pseudouridine synthase [Pirellula staleyi]ADB17487.1 pseudouridine synthase [Pirellula staleyi DSM 6068]